MEMKSAKVLVAAAVLAIAASSSAHADVASDRAAAILVLPYVAVGELEPFDSGGFSVAVSVDTVIQVSNTSTDPAILHCFYVSANGHCSLTGGACHPAGGLFDGGCPQPQDLCLPGWTETDFQIVLTPRQPIAWSAERGLAREEFPLDGRAFVGPQGHSNAGSAIPPVTKERLAASFPPMAPQISTFTGELKCVVVDAAGRAIDRNVIKGEATVVGELRREGPAMDEIVRVPVVSKYSAVGIQAIAGDENGDDVLELGGDANEYNGCANVLIVDHFFDFARLAGRPTALSSVRSALTLVPCAQDLRAQVPGSTTAQFLVFNEFEQRFSTSRRVDCWFTRRLSLIDTADPSRSIFNAGIVGTVAGQTRVRGVSSGLVGVLHEGLHEEFDDVFGIGEAATNPHMQGERAEADRLIIP